MPSLFIYVVVSSCHGDVVRDLQLIRVLRALQIANLGVTGTTNIKMLNVSSVICHPKESKSLKAMFFNLKNCLMLLVESKVNNLRFDEPRLSKF